MTNAQPDESLSNDAGETDACAPAVVALIPPRYRWLKFFLKLGGVLVVALWVLRLWWGWEANRRLQAQIQSYRDAGQLVYAEEFDALLDAVPDEQNAALLYEQAVAIIVETTASGVKYQEFFNKGTSFLKQHMAEAEELVRLNQPVLDLVREARAKPQVAWSVRLRDFTNTNLIGPMMSHRHLSRLLMITINYQFQTGNHAGAVATLHDFERYNLAVVDHPALIAALFGWERFTVSCGTIENYATQLMATRDGQVGGTVTSPARREDVEHLVSTLLEEETLGRFAVASILGERARKLDLLNWPTRCGAFTSRVFRPQKFYALGPALDWCWRPASVLDAGRVAEEYTQAGRAVIHPSHPAAELMFQVQPLADGFVITWSRPFTKPVPWNSYTTFLHTALNFHTMLAHRRMAATALAIRLYTVDHGHRPSKLADMVPRYLPAVPLDPYAADQAPIRYNPDTEPALLYSVGTERLDDVGKPRWDLGADRRDGRYDLLFFLDGRPSEERSEGPPVSHQASDEDKNGHYRERDATEGNAPQD